MIAVLLIVIPLLTGLGAFFFRNEKAVRSWAFVSALATLAVSVSSLTVAKNAGSLTFNADWMPALGASFALKLDGMSQLLCLLTAVSYPVIFLATWKTEYRRAHSFFALMLLAQAGLMGVFLAMDALLFYFFWELALIPVYFLCSLWGGERRIPVTFKFFVYTFLGSVLMLIGILYVYSFTADGSFAIESFYAVKLSGQTQQWLFWLFFIAFAIKMPVFPFHTWQPDTYEQSPTATTMVLSGIMVKMGVFGLLRWLLPVVPVAAYQHGDTVSWLAIIGMIYASLIAIQQNDLKRLIAYSSIAHIGLMCLAIFAETRIGMQGVMIQMFNHGINIIGLWIVVEWIERKYGTRRMSELGGLAQKAPGMAILLMIVALANIALPLTNAFVGEFLMFSGIYTSDITKYNVWFTVAAGICIILAAVYTLRMIRKVCYGDTVPATSGGSDMGATEKIALGIIVLLIFWAGIYPQTLLKITNDVSENILKLSDIHHLLKK